MDTSRSDKERLLGTVTKWNSLLTGAGRVRMIACGGTALTLLGYKESTKDIDLIIPEAREYERFIGFLRKAGYRQDSGSSGWRYPGENIVYDLYEGKRVFTTELLDSPLGKGRNRKVLELRRVYLGVLNPIDLIITKMFRGTSVDREDCLALAMHEEIDLVELEARYRETASYDTSEKRVLKNLEAILGDLKKIRGVR